MAEQVNILDICEKQEQFNEISSNLNICDNTVRGETNEDVDNQKNSFCNKILRYTTYDLLSLRNGQLSIHYPDCALRSELQALSVWTCRLRCKLQYLGLWKIPNTGNLYGNCNCNGICQSYACGDGETYIVSSNQPLQASTNSSPTLGSKRAVRSRERFLNYQRCINTSLIGPTSPTAGKLAEGPIQHHLNHEIKPPFIDIRSISSSHLMPAFAKRRMGNTYADNASSAKSSNNNIDNLSIENEDIELSIKCRKDSTTATSNQNGYIMYKTSVNSDKSDQTAENQAGWVNLVKKPNADYSPSNSKLNNVGSVNKKLIYERRIGSGRLVSREGNWDMKTLNKKQIETQNNVHSNISNNSLVNKNSVENVEKVNNRNTSRRCFDRRISNTDDSNSNANSSTTNKRFNTSSHLDERNNYDANYHHQTQHLTGQRSMSFRRREYIDHKDCHREFRDQKNFREHQNHNDHKEEPEWFSEGPTSQHDTIELRGFDEINESHQHPAQLLSDQSLKTERRSSKSSLLSHNTTSNLNLSPEESFDVAINVPNNYNHTNISDNETVNDSTCNDDNAKATQTKIISDVNKATMDTQQILSNHEALKNSDIPRSNVTELFFDNFLSIEALENTLIGSANDQSTFPNNKSGGTSRFSRWFLNNANNNNDDKVSHNLQSKDESTQLIKDINESDFSSFMALLKSNTFPTPELPKGLPSNVSALNVKELEAKMRKIDSVESKKTNCEGVFKKLHKIDDSHTKKTKSESKPESFTESQDIEAFRKLLDQLGKPPVDISMNITLPNTLSQSHFLNTPSDVHPPTGLIAVPNSTLSQSNMTKQEYILKNMHQQHLHHQQNVAKMATPYQQQHLHQRIISSQHQKENLHFIPLAHQHSHHVPMIMAHPQNRHNVQHLIQSVVRDELSRNFLEQELKNPNVSSNAKEIISTLLKETSRYNPATTGAQIAQSPNCTETATQKCSSAAPGNLMQSLARGEVSLSLLEHELNKLNNMSIGNESPNSCVFKDKSQRITPLNPASIQMSSSVIVPLPAQLSPAHKQNSILTKENACTILPDKQQEQAMSSVLLTHHEDATIDMSAQRELNIHAQAIVQNALFKNKLEVEHEVLRRRQENQKQQELEPPCIRQHHKQQPINSTIPQQGHQSTTRHMNSATPLAFTPTSVLRKMTAEKDTLANSTQTTTITSSSPQQNQHYLQQPHIKLPTHAQIHSQQMSYQHSNQPRMILGGGNFQYMNQQLQISAAANGSPQISPQQKSQLRNELPAPLKWPLTTHSAGESHHYLLNNMSNKPIGRPILKGPGPIQPLVSQNAQNSLEEHNHTNVNHKFQTSQMQKYQPLQPRQIVGEQFPRHTIQHQICTSQQSAMQHQLFQQRPVVIRHQIQPIDSGNHAIFPLPAQHSTCRDNNTETNLNYQRDGGLSPTSNQLAQWFSPELLAQASAGKLPLLNMNQALSLEDFERSIQHSSTAVNN